MDRRESLKLIAVAALGASIPGCGPEEVRRAADAAAAVDGSFANYEQRFFTDAEMATVRVLSDMIIPADDRSGSATDARVPEFIDFMASEVESLRVPLRGGLAWLDHVSRAGSAGPFSQAPVAYRRAILDTIAWPDTADPSVSQGVRFFTLFRDLCASGFFSSRMGMDDLGYMGNQAIPEWTGCSAEAMAHVRGAASGA